MEHMLRIDGREYLLTSDDDYLGQVGIDFKPSMVKLFKTLIGPDDTVVDVGSNIGLTTILFSQLAKKVFAFEPSPSTFAIMRKNLARAKSENVDSINLGLGDRDENTSITFSFNNRSGGFVSDKIQLKEGHITERIRVKTLDSILVDRAVPINFIKIDVEGFEASVINGARKILEKDRPIVIMELNHFCLTVFRRVAVPDYFDFLRSIFPYLYAVDGDNGAIANLHDESQAYHVMHEHIIRFRFPNIVAGFDDSFVKILEGLQRAVKEKSLPGNNIKHVTKAGCLKLEISPERVKQGDEFFLDVTVFNESNSIWEVNAEKPVLLSYHWLDLADNTLVHDGERSFIGCDQLIPGQSHSHKMKVIAPYISGHLSLVLTLVQEGVVWFEEQGFKPRCVQVTVSK